MKGAQSLPSQRPQIHCAVGTCRGPSWEHHEQLLMCGSGFEEGSGDGWEGEVSLDRGGSNSIPGVRNNMRKS